MKKSKQKESLKFLHKLCLLQQVPKSTRVVLNTAINNILIWLPRFGPPLLRSLSVHFGPLFHSQLFRFFFILQFNSGCNHISLSPFMRVTISLWSDFKWNVSLVLLSGVKFKGHYYAFKTRFLARLHQYPLDCPWVSHPSAPTCIFPRHPLATHWATLPRAYITQSPPVTTATSRLPMAWWLVSDDLPQTAPIFKLFG